ncbi:uncharacterized protein RJT21DRAFT_13160 [Scheffersomyces amazonensis]|uniref:uncharacterized protein n=1 Tax=Scheffersomyces amazonensis TaxID=1078765 RepID=UPI00315C7E9C
MFSPQFTSSIDNFSTHHKKCISPPTNVIDGEFYHIKHHKPFEITTVLSNEISYLNWYNNVETLLQEFPQFQPFINLQLLPINEENDEEYQQITAEREANCVSDLETNQFLIEKLAQSIQPQLHYLITSNSVCKNFENLKQYFQTQITGFYLLNMENSLTINLSNILQFLIDLDDLCKVYFFIFRDMPNHQLKIQWIMNSINKLNNPELQLEVQMNWEKINRDPIYIRKILTIYSNKLKLRRKF